jgi:acyl carrier protein
LPGPPSTEQATTPTAGAAPPSPEEVLAEVRTLLVDVIGDDFLLDTEIELDTSFNEDLELESIEFVALSERLLERYGAQVDFVAWMAEMDLDEIIALTVGELVDFIVTSVG